MYHFNRWYNVFAWRNIKFNISFCYQYFNSNLTIEYDSDWYELVYLHRSIWQSNEVKIGYKLNVAKMHLICSGIIDLILDGFMYSWTLSKFHIILNWEWNHNNEYVAKPIYWLVEKWIDVFPAWAWYCADFEFSEKLSLV